MDGIAGTVDTIGLLALTLRTFDNRSVRIPNETLVKTKLINITRHPIRRFNLDIGVAYDENIGHVLKVMQEVAETNLQCLNDTAHSRAERISQFGKIRMLTKCNW